MSRLPYQFFEAGDIEQYLNCQILSAKIYHEQEDTQKILEISKKVGDLALTATSKISYLLGMCHAYQEEYVEAHHWHQQALVQATAGKFQNEYCICFIWFGEDTFFQKEWKLTQKALTDLQPCFEVLHLEVLEPVVQILQGQLFMQKGRASQALGTLWSAYEQAQKNKNLYVSLHALYELGVTYKKMGNKKFARLYLGLLQKTLDVQQMPRLFKQLQSHLVDLNIEGHGRYDLIVKPYSVYEGQRGKIMLGNQFTVRKLLHLLAKNPPKVYTKEQIAKHIWSQRYDPFLHDNKIYVNSASIAKVN